MYSSLPSLAPLRAFVKRQPSYPDDLAFGTFVNWASGAPAVCTDETARRLGDEVEAEEGISWSNATARRRLGLSGGPEWHFLRTHGSMWILYFFGGFYSHTGCWAAARGPNGYELAKDNERYRERCAVPDLTPPSNWTQPAGRH